MEDGVCGMRQREVSKIYLRVGNDSRMVWKGAGGSYGRLVCCEAGRSSCVRIGTLGFWCQRVTERNRFNSSHNRGHRIKITSRFHGRLLITEI